MTEEKNTSLHPISELLCELYQTLVSKGEVAFPLYEGQIRKLDSVVKTVHASYYGLERYPTPQDKAAAYFTFIIKDHAVTDGNKRLAVLFLGLYCFSVDLKITLPNDTTIDQLAVSVEKSGEAHLLVPDVKRILFSR
jgi:prophage maintenance system killer protein